MQPKVVSPGVTFPSLHLLHEHGMIDDIRPLIEGTTSDFQNCVISWRAVDIKILRRFGFCDLVVPGRMDKRANLGEGMRDSSYMSL